MRDQISRRFFTHLFMICIFTFSWLAGPGAALAVSAPAVPALPSRSDPAVLRAQLPDNPLAAVGALVETVFGADESQAQAAVAELLRRAGLPVVSIAGPVTGLPDDLALADAPVYVELLPDLTRAMRRGDFYTPSQLSDLLFSIGYSSVAIEPAALVAGLGQWGKSPTAALESLVAGTAVRALSGRRLQVLYAGADLETIQLDPVQIILILAHATGNASQVIKPSAWTAPGLSLVERLMGVQGIARAAADEAAAPGPCDALAAAIKRDTPVGEAVQDKLKEGLQDSWGQFIKQAAGETAGKVFETAATIQEKGSAVLSTLLLLLGATIQVTADNPVIHFGHPKVAPQHVKLEALAFFDSSIAKQKVACYSLAGIEVPPPGRMKDFRVRWSLYQPYGGPAGKLLEPISADIKKLDSCGSCGEVTGESGTSTLELTPPIENSEPAKTSPVIKGNVRVKASLDKDDFPVKLSDLFAIPNPLALVAKKTWDLAISAITKAGLPSQSLNISVAWHGGDIFVSKGQTNVFLFYWNGPVKLDIYTCEGLAGNWNGTGGVGGITENGWGFLAEKVVGDIIPNSIADSSGKFQFMINPQAEENKFEIVPGAISGVMRTNTLVNTNAIPIVNGRLARVAGEVELLLGDLPLSLLSFGAGTVYPLYWVPEDPRCPQTGAHFGN